jgi:hypothetical protein
MSVGTLLAPQTELQPWSSLYANSLHVENVVSEGNLSVGGNLTVSGTTSLYTLATSGPVTFGGVLNMAGSPIINAGSISSSGTYTSSGQSIAYFTSPPSATQPIPDSMISQVTLLSNMVAQQGGDITINPAGPLITFNASGFYSISVGLRWIATGFTAAALNAEFYLYDPVSSSSYIVSSASPASGGSLSLTGTIAAKFTAGQQLVLAVYQNSGATQSLGAGQTSTDSFVSVYRLF